MNDLVWQNIRYLLIAAGAALAAKYCNGCIGTPIIEQAVGVIIAFGTILWGNYVKKGTKAVPEDVAASPSIPTVNPATGAVESGTKFTG